MYVDFSIRKAGFLALIACIMLFAVIQTFALKEGRYGSTPPFASFGLMSQEVGLRARYAIEGSVFRLSQAAGSAFAFLGFKPQTDGPSRSARAIPVLTYHRIVGSSNDFNNVTTGNFRDQMFALKRAGWETVTLKEYREFMAGTRELPEKSFLITFDDGAKESFYPVDPLFDVLGYEGVLYVIASAMYTPESTYYLSPTEIRRLLDTGRWEIGSHSYDGHRPYPADAEGNTGIFFADKLWLEEENRLETDKEFTSRARDDLVHAREVLESEYGVLVDTFAFPLGNETGIEGAANFSEGAAITEREAKKVYSLGFLQTDPHRYSSNYQSDAGSIAYRIHVDHDWDGERLLRELQNGLPKDLPYEDDFSEDKGWIASWGALDLGRNNFSLSADEGASSASAFLDGSKLWDNYSFNVSMNWHEGSAFLIADVVNSKTYDACVFSNGVVRLQTTVNGETSTLAEKRDPSIRFGDGVRPGIRVHDAVIECLWNYESILEAYERRNIGGVGVQVWNPQLGTAALTVSDIAVQPL
ncbi:MAG: polysaccharide deacetylase family protein [Patescibacteria group bacterium]|nr:polysaccharide deacetylase family protein [Patescibacteria group bacterium]